MLLSIIILSLIILYIAFVIIEKIMIHKMRKTFKYVIHVNGIRGKSTTTRLIDAGLRGCGFKVFSKTTGTFPTYINTNNEMKLIKRLGPANIREQIRMMYKAYKEKCDCLVLECMAVNPELQYICEHRILNSDVTIITNVRPDHIGDMGNTLEELAMALANTIPTKGHLIVSDDKYLDLFKEKASLLDSTVHIATPYDGDDLGTFKDNIACALEVARVLDLDTSKYYEGMKEYKQDLGAYKEIKYEDTLFMNALSVNDPESIEIVYNKATEERDKKEISIVICTREDRAFRTKQYLDLVKKMEYKNLYITEYSSYLLFKRNKIEAIYLKKVSDLLNEKYVFATGNIVGTGTKILKFFQEKGE